MGGLGCYPLTCEVPLSMFCHLLTGSAATSQSAHADCRSLANVDFPTADIGGSQVTSTHDEHHVRLDANLSRNFEVTHTYVALDRNPLHSSWSVFGGAEHRTGQTPARTCFLHRGSSDMSRGAAGCRQSQRSTVAESDDLCETCLSFYPRNTVEQNGSARG